MKKGLPIVFLHDDYPDYLDTTFLQAQKSNPDSRIILIGSKKNANCPDFVEHYDCEEISSELIERIEKAYVHFSPNSYKYDIFCIKRWFFMLELFKKLNINSFLHLDPDVLIYVNATKEIKNYQNCEFTLSGVSGHTMYVNNLEVLEKFCKFVVELYENPYSLSVIKNMGESCVISDMNLLIMFTYFIGRENVAFLDKKRDNAIYDIKFDYTSKEFFSKIIFENNGFYGIEKGSGQKVFYKTIHFQGKMKKYMEMAYKYHKIIHKRYLPIYDFIQFWQSKLFPKIFFEQE